MRRAFPVVVFALAGTAQAQPAPIARLSDTFGSRFSGSENLERAIDWILTEMRREGLQNVRGEEVMVPRWVRGAESAELIGPRRQRLAMLGLGGSIGTPPEGITAEVLVVSSFDDLKARAAQARGKMVLFDVPFTSYGATAELDNHVLAIESDGGVFRPVGFGFTGGDSARAILRQVVSLLRPIGADSLLAAGGGADIGPIMQRGVPGMSHVVDGSRYFWYHHTEADTPDKLDPREVARNVAAIAVMSYVVADLPDRLPRR